MRAWGITFVITAAACTVLPAPLAYFLVAVVATAATVALASTYGDHRARVEAVQRQDTQKTLDYLQLIRTMDDDVEAEWAKILGTVTAVRPLAACAARPPRQRLVTPRIPTPRTPSGAS